jgi:fibronectin-binding autotransporter adhesin
MFLSFFQNSRLRSKAVLVTIVLLILLVKITIAQTHVWTPSIGPTYQWNIAGNWRDASGNPVGSAPGPLSTVLFNAGSATCNMPFGTASTIAGLEISSGFTGTISFSNSQTLTVNGPALLMSGVFTQIAGASIFTINSGTSVVITGIRTSITTVVNISAGTATIDSNIFGADFTLRAPADFTITGNAFNSNTYIEKTGGVDWTMDGGANTLISWATLTVRNTGTASLVYKNQSLAGSITLDNNNVGKIATDLLTSRNLTITNTSSGIVSVDRHTLPLNTNNGNATITNSGSGSTWFDNSTVNGTLTINRNAGTINICHNGTCKLAGNLIVQGAVTSAFTIGNGSATSAAMEFIGNNPQTVTRVGGATSPPLIFTKIILNKTSPQTITVNTAVDVSEDATMTMGILVSGANLLRFNDPSRMIGYSNTSFVDGLLGFISPGSSVIYPIGSSGVYRPVTINFGAGVPNISARYFKAGAPAGSLAGVTRVSACEFWTVTASSASPYKVTLPWVGSNCADAPNYVSDLSQLVVSRFSGGAWQNNGGAPGGGSTIDAGTITSDPMTGSIGNITIASVGAENLLSLSNTTVWTPTAGGPTNYNWSNSINWSRGVPDASKIAVFNATSTTCVLPPATPVTGTTITVGGLETSGTFTGNINVNGCDLFVNAIGTTKLTTGTISSASVPGVTNAGLRISTNSSVDITGITTAAVARVLISVLNTSAVTVNSNTFNHTFSLTAQDNIVVTGNTFNSTVTIVKSGPNPYTMPPLSSTNTFGTNSAVTLRNSGTGNLTIASSETFSVPLTIIKTAVGSGALTADLLTTANLTVTHSNTGGTVTITRLAANGNVIVSSSLGATTSFDQVTVNGNLTLTRNDAGSTINACYTGNCKLGGNLVVNGTTATAMTIGNGVATSGALEFIGSAPQLVSSNQSPLIFTKVVLNKTLPETVTLTNTDVNVTVLATMTQGIISTGVNTFRFNTPSVVAGSPSDLSFVDGWAGFTSGNGPVTFPTGFAVGRIYRPITINFAIPDGGTPKTARYYKSNPPSSPFVTGPITNVSTLEYWTVNATPNNNFTVNLTWKNADFNNPSYVTDVNKLRVSRLEAGQWVNRGGPTAGGSASNFAGFSPVVLPQGGSITSTTMNISGANIGDLTLGSTDALANYLADLFIWQPTAAAEAPNYRWDTPANWKANAVPTPTSTPAFLSGNTTCWLPADVNVAGLRLAGTFTGTIDHNGKTLTINANSGTTLSTGSFGGTGSLVINGGDFPITISGVTVAPTLIASGSALNVTNSVFNGDVTITKTGPSTSSWAGGNTYTANTIITTQAGTLQFPTALADNFKNLTLTRNGGVVNPCYTADCKVSGNLTVNGSASGVYTFGNGTPASGALELNGIGPQAITIGAGIPSLSLQKLNLTKPTLETVTANTDVSVTGIGTLTRGILVLSNDKSITFNTPSAISAASIDGFVDGWIKFLSASGTATFPTGYGAQKQYRPVSLQINASDGSLNNLSARYYRATHPDITSVNGVTNVSTCEYWYVDAYPRYPVKISLSWKSADCGNAAQYITDLNFLKVSRYEYWSNTDWQNHDVTAWSAFPGDPGPASPTMGTITSDFINMPNDASQTIGAVTLGSTNPIINALPIELSAFAASVTPAGVALEWKTLSELNNDYFEVQRSADGLEFMKIGEVPGHGTSRVPVSYSFDDPHPLVGRSYYRLKQVDFDGVFSYSKIVSVFNESAEGNRFTVYPVPINRGETLSLSIKDDVQVLDQMGNIVLTDFNVNEIKTDGFKPGVYCARIKSGRMCRFVVQ